MNSQGWRRRSIKEMLADPRPISGGDGTAVAYPLGAPTVAGNEITVDMMLQQPTRVTRFISDITQQRFIADRLFASPGGVTGGAVIYDQAVENELFTERDVEQVAPGTEFPLVRGKRRAPKIAPVEKWGGKDFITDEARDRNNQAAAQNSFRAIGNTIVRKINARSVEVLEAAIAEHGQTMPGHNWTTVQLQGQTPTAPDLTPVGDFAAANLLAEEQELGVRFDTAIVNPAEKARLIMLYGANNWEAVLRALGYDEVYSSMRVTAGTAYVAASRQVGEMRVEKPLGTETWREQLTERNWIQSSVRPVQYVTNPFSVLKLTGLAG